METPSPREQTLIVLEDDRYVDAYVGYRAWKLSVERGIVSLRAIAWWSFIWPKEPFRARCFQHEHEAPASKQHLNCNCGINAYADPFELARKYRPGSHGASTVVLGEVQLWGTIRVHELGYRAEWGKVSALWQPPDGPGPAMKAAQMITTLAAERYNVPVVQAPPAAHRLIEVA